MGHHRLAHAEALLRQIFLSARPVEFLFQFLFLRWVGQASKASCLRIII